MLEYKEFQDIDLKLHLQSGSEIKLGNLVIKPYIIEEIKDYGYNNYMQNLQLLSISIDDFVQSVIDIEKRMILEEQMKYLKTFDFYATLGGKELLSKLLNVMSMVFRTDDIRLLDDGIMALDFVKLGVIEIDENGQETFNEEVFDSLEESQVKLIHRNNFDDIVEIVKYQNYMEKASQVEKSEEQYADEETRKLMEDMDRHRKRVEDKKRAQAMADGNDSEVDITDIISAVSSKSNSVNRLTIWKYTLYQLYDEYSRLELIDNYNFSIKAMLAGAEKVDLKHWSSRL